MPNIDPNLLIQSGFAGLFIWLLISTRNDSQRREERLESLLEQYSKNLPLMAESLSRIEARLERIEDAR